MAALALVVIGLGWAAMRILQLQSWERSVQLEFSPRQVEQERIHRVSGKACLEVTTFRWPDPRTLEISATLCGQTPISSLLRDDVPSVRLVSTTPMSVDLDGISDSSAMIWSEPPLVAEVSRMARSAGCLAFLHRAMAVDGALELVWQEGALGTSQDGTLSLQVATQVPLGGGEWALLGVLLLAALLLLAAGQRTPRGGASPSIGVAVVGLVVFCLVPIAWPFGPMSSVGLFLSSVLTALAYVAALWIGLSFQGGGSLLARLSFHRTTSGRWWGAAGAGLLLALMAYLATPLYEGKESEMTRMVSASSGVLSLAALGLISAWAEELLLRGAVYGACDRRWGPVLAIGVSAGVFSLLHLAQHWGNLAAWGVVSVTGLGLSLVRFATGSTLASTVAHLVYNLALIMPAMVLAS
ncbi:MAG: CPBP family intramembrane metalloprotease [Bradymonadales bacterium]|nr:CPBP family intramembrane metalloprotease [Bradymonadales bacterium]